VRAWLSDFINEYTRPQDAENLLPQRVRLTSCQRNSQSGSTGTIRNRHAPQWFRQQVGAQADAAHIQGYDVSA
jgi:hypothetical protein